MGLLFPTTTELAAPLIRAFQAPAGVQVMVVFEADSRCHTVVQACRDQGVHFASPLKGNRRLCTQGWKLQAGRYGKHLLRRRRTTLWVIETPARQVRYRWIDAGWLQVSTLGPWPVGFSRQGAARKVLGLVPGDPERSAVGLIPTDEKRWAVELFFKDSQQLLGLGHDQNRSDGAAVTPLPLVCVA